MNHGPLIFLAAFFALASSWVGFVLTPHLQVGHLQPTNTLSAAIYPQARPGLAQQGLQVYRANGCVSCHSQQVQQTGNITELMLFDTGTNHEAVVSLLGNLQLTNDVSGLPKAVWRGTSVEHAVNLAKQLKARGAKASVWIVPVGPDLARGWGKRRTVAEDFLYDTPAMPGSQRIGPDLADVGSRLPDSYWHLRHLYEPTLEKKDSKMPPYRFLFHKQKIQRARSPEALPLAGKLAPEPGFEVVPTAEAKALAAYLVSLRVDEPLFVAPFFTAAPVEATGTNTLSNTNAAASTNPPSAGSVTPTNATQK
jgi:cbb3-type cytochrome oxidase cytochrome c subunit